MLALSSFSSPWRLATRADTAALIEKNIDKAINFGWVVRPTAATALGPMDETMKVSMMPAIDIKKNSKTAGQATLMAFLI